MGHFHHKMDEIQLSVIISSNNGCFSMGHYHPYLESDYTCSWGRGGGTHPAGPYADKPLPYYVFLAASDELGSDYNA